MDVHTLSDCRALDGAELDKALEAVMLAVLARCGTVYESVAGRQIVEAHDAMILV